MRRLSTSSFAMFVFPAAMVVLADNIMSYLFPVVVEGTLMSNTELGAIMAFSSVVGIVFDLFLSHRITPGFWRFGFRAGIILSLGFPILTVFGSLHTSLILLLLASGVWGVYFELIAFGMQDFIATTQPRQDFTRDWSIVHVIWALTAIVSPIIGAALLQQNPYLTIAVVGGLQLMGLFASWVLIDNIENTLSRKPKLEILKLGRSLFAIIGLEIRVFPITIVTFAVQMVFSCFWTIGGLFGVQLSELPWLFVTLYVLGIILGSLTTGRLEIRSGKKKLAMLGLTFGGAAISLIAFVHSASLIYLLAFLGGLALAIVTPLNESVYSDLAKRAPEWEMELISLSRIATSFAYIIGPLSWGFLADRFGYATTFGLAGLFAAIIGLSMLLITPRKLKMSHSRRFIGINL